MEDELEDARKLAHGTYDDVIVVEHRKRTGASSTGSSGQTANGALQEVHVVLEMPEESRVLDTAQHYEIDGVIGTVAPKVGTSYRVIIGPPTVQAGENVAGRDSSLRYETMKR
jgi:hypothetical protein